MAVPPPDSEDAEIARNRRTLYLIIGGVASLLVPLLGALYIKMSDNSIGNSAGSAAVMFNRRAAGDAAPTLNPAAAAAAASSLKGHVTAAAPRMNSPKPTSSPEGSAREGGGSLGFIRGGDDYYGDGDTQLPVGQTPQQQAQTETKAPPPPAGAVPQSQAAAVEPAASKPGAKTFSMPKLKPTSGFSDYKSRGGSGLGSGGAGAPNPAAAAPTAAAGGAQQPQSAWKPAAGPGSGANLPQMGQLGEKKGAPGAPGAPGMPAMPDIGGLLEGAMPPGGLPKEAGGVKMPDVGGLLNSIPGMGGDTKKKK